MIRNRDSLSLAFALICLGMLIYIPCNLFLYQVTTPSRYLEIVRIQMYGTAFFHLGLLWFVLMYLGYAPRRYLTIYGLVFGIFLLLRSINPSLMYASFERMIPCTTLLEQRVQERTRQLELSNQELEAFSYSVSHDLRAPLRVIDGYSNLLIEDYGSKLDPTAHQFLSDIYQSVKRMNAIIDALLHLALINRSELVRETVNLSFIAETILAELQQHEPQRQVEVYIQPDLVVQVDPKLLYIALENLLGNAWKFTRKQPHTEILFSMVTHAGQNCYCVRDNGAGFDMRYQGKLFNAFQRLHDPHEFEGTGVGLATVQRIIRKHGGQIFAEAEVDHGAAFYFTLG